MVEILENTLKNRNAEIKDLKKELQNVNDEIKSRVEIPAEFPCITCG